MKWILAGLARFAAFMLIVSAMTDSDMKSGPPLQWIAVMLAAFFWTMANRAEAEK
jgi:phosphatidylserine synthase